MGANNDGDYVPLDDYDKAREKKINSIYQKFEGGGGAGGSDRIDIESQRDSKTQSDIYN